MKRHPEGTQRAMPSRWGGKGVRVAGCPIEQEWCYPSCHWRKGKRCYFSSKWGRWIPELKRRGGD